MERAMGYNKRPPKFGKAILVRMEEDVLDRLDAIVQKTRPAQSRAAVVRKAIEEYCQKEETG